MFVGFSVVGEINAERAIVNTGWVIVNIAVVMVVFTQWDGQQLSATV